jgi:hypothetical protein
MNGLPFIWPPNLTVPRFPSPAPYIPRPLSDSAIHCNSIPEVHHVPPHLCLLRPLGSRRQQAHCPDLFGAELPKPQSTGNPTLLVVARRSQVSGRRHVHHACWYPYPFDHQYQAALGPGSIWGGSREREREYTRSGAVGRCSRILRPRSA